MTPAGGSPASPREWRIVDTSFLPWPLSEASSSPGASWEFDGLIVFVDIAGFTRLSEALGACGPEGTEQLHEILNEFFGALIDVMAAEGGHTVAFAGDSATVLFTPGNAVLERAHRAADTVQRVAATIRDRMTIAGPIDIEVKIGIGAGSIRARVLGDDERRRPVFDGSALDAAVAAEHGASAGETRTHSSVADLDVGREAPGWATGHSPDHSTTFLHPAIVERLANSSPELMAEHRAVTTLFCGYELDDLDSEDDFLRRALDIVDTYGGYLLEVEHGDKGAKFMMLFGAPVAHADSADRAMSAALACRELPGATTRIGVGTGRCFTGVIGNDRRRVWTVVGDTVNLAARLMQHAGSDEIQTDRRTASRVTDRFHLVAPSQPITVKGKDEPVLPHLLVGVAETPEAAAPTHDGMVGRSEEIAQLRQWLTAAAGGRGSTVLVCGPAGIGKSTLASAGKAAATEAGFASLNARFDLLTRTDGYGGLRSLLRTLLDEAHSEIDRHDIRQFALQSLIDPSGTDDHPVEANPEERRALAHSLVADLLAAVSRRTPHLLVIDDCQWIDPASQALIEDLGRISHRMPLVILLLTRPVPLEIDVDHRLDLDQLSDRDAASIARSQLPEGVTTFVVDAIGDRAGGNPLFVEELARQYEETGEVSSAPTLIDAVAAAVDRLPPREREALKRASVLGRSFPRTRFVSLALPSEHQSDPDEQLDRLLERGMLTVTQGSELQFRHDTLLEVSYDLLPFARRAVLHEQVGDLIESRAEGHRDEHLDELAYHYGRSRNTPKQRTYLRLAGDRAAELFTVETAIDYFRRLREITEGDEAAYADLRLGAMLEVAGNWPDSIAALRAAAGADDPSTRAPAQALVGRLLQSTGRTVEADRLLEAAVQTELSPSERLDVLAQASLAAYEAGSFDRQIEFVEEARVLISLDRSLDGKKAEVEARLGAALAGKGDADAARKQMASALDLARASGQRRLEGILLCDLASLATELGDINEASALFADALGLADEIGDRPTSALVLGNVADLMFQVSRFRPSDRLARTALGQVLTLGDRVGALYLLGGCGRTRRELGDIDGARDCLELGLTASESGPPALRTAFRLELGVTSALRGDLAAAERCFAAARDCADDPVSRCRSSLWLAVVLAETDSDRACSLLASVGDTPAVEADAAFARYRISTATSDRTEALDAYERGGTVEDGPEVDRRVAELGGQPTRRDVPLEPPLESEPENLAELLIRSARLFALPAPER